MVSVIIPMYNSKDTIERCLNSVKNQTYEGWEAIIVDDASTDESVEVCRKVAGDDPRVHIYTLKKNSGPAVARNYGLSVCMGDWVSFIDSDDEIDTKCLSRAVEVAEKNQADIVMWGLVNIRNGKEEDYHRTFCGDERVFDKGKIGEVISLLYTVKGEDGSRCLNLTGPVSKLFNSKLAKSKKFPESITWAEDVCYLRQLLEVSNKLVYFDEIYYYRYIRKNSLSYNITSYEWKRRIDYVNWMMEYNEKTSEIKVDIDYNQIMYNTLAELIRAYVHIIPRMPAVSIKKAINQCRESLIYEIDFSKVEDRMPIMVKCIDRGWFYLYKVLFVICNIIGK